MRRAMAVVGRVWWLVVVAWGVLSLGVAVLHRSSHAVWELGLVAGGAGCVAVGLLQRAITRRRMRLDEELTLLGVSRCWVCESEWGPLRYANTPAGLCTYHARRLEESGGRRR